MTDAITITLPLPPKELNPNGRYHWRAKMGPKKRYREEVLLVCCSHWNTGDDVPRKLTDAEITIDYYHKTRRHRDPDNIIAHMKAGIDGLVDAGVLADDRDVTYRVRRHTDKDYPRVELTVTPMEQSDV